jgi:steroid 5-alpha reductase family enzyme
MYLTTLAAALTLFFLLWILSLAMKDASVVDRYWGIAFIVIASATSAATEGFETRSRLVLVLVTLWGARLSLYITVRNLGGGEDFRYRAMRERWGTRFPIVSLATVFGLQALLAWIVSLPVQAAIAAVFPARLTALDRIGVAVWIVGFAFEAVGDWQLSRFRAKARNRGRLLTTGLWKYSRHPNYFGDALQWWGLWLIAAATGAWWTVVGPLLMTLLLLRVSGVTLLEKRLRRSREGYEDYCRRTSAFVPTRPRRV